MGNLTLLNQKARIVEYDGRFTIEVLVVRKSKPFRWFWQDDAQEKIEELWLRCNEHGKLDCGFDFRGSPCFHCMKQFDSLDDAISKIESLNKGIIIHEL